MNDVMEDVVEQPPQKLKWYLTQPPAQEGEDKVEIVHDGTALKDTPYI